MRAPDLVGGQPGQGICGQETIYTRAQRKTRENWSSFGAGGYAQGLARSASGQISGPWIQEPEPLYAQDGGHGMIFRAFDGRLMLSLHKPNRTSDERPYSSPCVRRRAASACSIRESARIIANGARFVLIRVIRG